MPFPRLDEIDDGQHKKKFYVEPLISMRDTNSVIKCKSESEDLPILFAVHEPSLGSFCQKNGGLIEAGSAAARITEGRAKRLWRSNWVRSAKNQSAEPNLVI
jgi:hypothetical protein